MGKKKKLNKADQAAFDKRVAAAKKGAATKRKNAKEKSVKKGKKSQPKLQAPKQFSTVVEKGQPRPMNLEKHGVKKKK